MPGCGNSILEAGEGCDDGNTTPGDGCNAVCLKELGQTCLGNMVCASGFCDSDGNVCACDEDADCSMPNVCNVVAAPNVCVAPGCGNSVIEFGEGCDDGNTTANDGCDVN
jgi:cysteine-rich repeat protein